jgi:hypothetical protein
MKPREEPKQKPYTRPQLYVYGSVHEMTQMNVLGMKSDEVYVFTFTQ